MKNFELNSFINGKTFKYGIKTAAQMHFLGPMPKEQFWRERKKESSIELEAMEEIGGRILIPSNLVSV